MTGRSRTADDLRAEIHELFAELWRVPRLSGMRHRFQPQCDCFRVDDPPALHVVLEIPGASPDSVQVVAGDRMLVVAGVRDRPAAERGRYRQMEIEYGAFHRRIELGEDVDAARMQATFDQGMLHVVLPVGEERP